MLCLLLSGRERGEADEEIMRDGGKWTDHNSDAIIKMILFCVDIEKIIRCTEDDKGEHDDNKRRPQQRKE